MESTQAPIKVPIKINYVITSEVLSIFERKTRFYLRGVGPDAVFEERSFGWYVLFEGSYEAVGIGETCPPWVVGDKIKITLEKV